MLDHRIIIMASEHENRGNDPALASAATNSPRHRHRGRRHRAADDEHGSFDDDGDDGGTLLSSSSLLRRTPSDLEWELNKLRESTREALQMSWSEVERLQKESASYEERAEALREDIARVRRAMGGEDQFSAAGAMSTQLLPSATSGEEGGDADADADAVDPASAEEDGGVARHNNGDDENGVFIESDDDDEGFDGVTGIEDMREGSLRRASRSRSLRRGSIEEAAAPRALDGEVGDGDGNATTQSDAIDASAAGNIVATESAGTPPAVASVAEQAGENVGGAKKKGDDDTGHKIRDPQDARSVPWEGWGDDDSLDDPGEDFGIGLDDKDGPKRAEQLGSGDCDGDGDDDSVDLEELGNQVDQLWGGGGAVLATESQPAAAASGGRRPSGRTNRTLHASAPVMSSGGDRRPSGRTAPNAPPSTGTGGDPAAAANSAGLGLMGRIARSMSVTLQNSASSLDLTQLGQGQQQQQRQASLAPSAEGAAEEASSATLPASNQQSQAEAALLAQIAEAERSTSLETSALERQIAEREASIAELDATARTQERAVEALGSEFDAIRDEMDRESRDMDEELDLLRRQVEDLQRRDVELDAELEGAAGREAFGETTSGAGREERAASSGNSDGDFDGEGGMARPRSGEEDADHDGEEREEEEYDHPDDVSELTLDSSMALPHHHHAGASSLPAYAARQRRDGLGRLLVHPEGPGGT